LIGDFESDSIIDANKKYSRRVLLFGVFTSVVAATGKTHQLNPIIKIIDTNYSIKSRRIIDNVSVVNHYGMLPLGKLIFSF
jgi:hypothetical protein